MRPQAETQFDEARQVVAKSQKDLKDRLSWEKEQINKAKKEANQKRMQEMREKIHLAKIKDRERRAAKLEKEL